MSTPTPDREAWGLVLELFFSHHRPRVWGVAAEFDLAPMQMLALKNLDPDEELPTSSLADLLHCDASNVTGIVDRLEARGLIERRPSAEVRRVKMLALTDEGQDLRRQIGERMNEPPPPIASLSEADQRALRDLLARALNGERGHGRDAPVPPQPETV
jgi:DNA-binding MarR family transcriptional regulator